MKSTTNLRRALLITASPATRDDESVGRRLNELGYDVIPRDCHEADPTKVRARRLSVIVLSPSVPAAAGGKFRFIAVPVVAMNCHLYPELRMTGTSAVNDYGEQSEEQRVLVISPNHPAAAELSGSLDISPHKLTIGWGIPSKRADTVATLTTDISKAVLFCYDRDETMVGLNAPARRVGIFYDADIGEHMDGQGDGFVSPYWRLFDATVEWAASEHPRQFPDVFRAEWSEVRTRRCRDTTPADNTRQQPLKGPPKNLVGLALSGGGIRAATFSLGLLQGLHRAGLLRLFDYLSTVSGGGYIGGWWSAWLSRDPEEQRGYPDLFPPPELIKPATQGADAAAADELQEVNSEVADELLSAGIDPIHHLRLFSNYLTPRKGILSPDTWRAATVVSRDLVLTWVVLLPVLIAALLLGKLYFVLQHHSYDSQSLQCFLSCGDNLPLWPRLRLRLVLMAWPLVVVLGWLAVSVCAWMVSGDEAETRREWWAGKFGGVVVTILLGLGFYLFYFRLDSDGFGTPRWVLYALLAGSVVMLLYFFSPSATARLFAQRTGDTEAARQWRGEVLRYRIARIQAKLVVLLILAAFILLLGGFGHELVDYVARPDTGAVAKAGGWAAVLVSVAGALFTALKNSPSGGSDERLLDENQSLFNRLVFRVTPTLVLLVLAVAVSWAASELLRYVNWVYVGNLDRIAAANLDNMEYQRLGLAYVRWRDEQTNLFPILTIATCFGGLLSFYFVLVETRWRNSAPRRWLAALWVVLALFLTLTLAGMLPDLPGSNRCSGQPAVDFLLQPCPRQETAAQDAADQETAEHEAAALMPPAEAAQMTATTEAAYTSPSLTCFSDLLVCLDRSAIGFIFFVSYAAGWWLIFRLRAGERRRPRRLVTPVLIMLVGVVLAYLSVQGVAVFYKDESIWVPLWLAATFGGALVYCLVFVVLETTLGTSDNKRALWLLTSVYLALNAMLGISLLVDYSDLQAIPNSPQALDFYLRVLLGQGVFGLFGTSLTWVLAMGWMADPNRLSLHEFYRSRLVRAYLGASNNYRSQQLKTIREAVEGDDVRLQDLRNCRRGAPYHLVNTTLNLVGGRDLTTAQRSADAFVLSKRYCGSSRTGYRDTREYMGGGLSLGTAVAVSGAAASPNMGAKTLTSSLAMLMTFLNVRLGYWAPTPNKKDWRETKARLWPFYMLREFTSQTNDLSTYCYLTDGGHFDNTGLYSLVERGCRFLVVADCGADPKPCFQDVGDALRRCRIDFAAEIDLDLRP